MNILMVNPVHPDTPHISAVRAWRFAQELAVLGHRVVLLTAPLAGKEPFTRKPLAVHDWQQPYVLEVEDGAQSQTRLPAMLRRLRTAWRLVMYGGAREQWVCNSVRAVGQQFTHFQPDVVWCTFGKMEAVFAAKRIATAAKCPWVLDIKDNWEMFVPSGLRRLMVWRTHGWEAVTANAEFTAQKTRRWQHANSEVIYSGVDEAFFTEALEADESKFEFAITLVGSFYFPDYLDAFLSGVQQWFGTLKPAARGRVLIRYLGGDIEMFRRAIQRCIPHIHTEFRGYVSVKELAQTCRASTVNAYVAHAGGFHHKLLELLACERPILVYPAESDESRRLVKDAEGQLIETSTPDQVASFLTQLYGRRLCNGADMKTFKTHQRYTWADQSRQLEQVLSSTISTNTKK